MRVGMPGSVTIKSSHALNPPFNRHRGERVIGQMVRALAHFLSSADAAKEPFSRAHYLREAPDED